MSEAIVAKVTLITETCVSCGTMFAMEQRLQSGLLGCRNTFYCPNGHAQSYVKPLEDKLREKDVALLAEKDAHEFDRKKIVRLEKQIAKMKEPKDVKLS